MFRTQLYLTDAQHQRLTRLARASGRSRSALLRDAVDRLLTSEAPSSDWKDRLRQARGMWNGREDLDEAMAEARRSMDRSFASA